MERGPEAPFGALLAAAGGRGQVLLVGELWEREPSRALLRAFARAVLPPEPAGAPGGPPGGPPGGRAIRSPLVFVLCRASSLAAPGPRRRVREMLRDVRGRRRAGGALVAVLVAGAGAGAGPDDGDGGDNDDDAALRLLEALLRAVFGRQAGGAVQAAAYRPDLPASSLAVQAAACRALQAAGPARPEAALERRGPPALLSCFAWGSWRRGKDPAAASPGDPAQGLCRDPEEEVALTAIVPNGDCDDPAKGPHA